MLGPELKKHVKKSLELVPIGAGPNEVQGAKEFYKYMFTQHPDLRKYFKGAENYTADDVQKSERFDKQGQRILLAMYILADTIDDAFFTVYVNFLETRGKLTDEQKAAWKEMGRVFDEECQSHLKTLGLPHV
ncbi:globin [Teladorsagia circumcincta]|uniref:Globin n=1 Tax=Teladorsagia circumcincta TaxID=45464 RepID=A0A2G9UZS2_TELCI|nr:globin [Teladorsagia circumcincta]